MKKYFYKKRLSFHSLSLAEALLEKMCMFDQSSDRIYLIKLLNLNRHIKALEMDLYAQFTAQITSGKANYVQK